MSPFHRKDLGPALHELGHLLGANPHPANYGNGYELMDSGYPCFTGAFTRMDATIRGEGFASWFGGWLPASNIQVFTPSTGGLVVLSPIELDPDEVTSPQALKVETATAGIFYVVECRRPISWDTLIATGRPASPGVLILLARSGNSKETKLMPTGDWLDHFLPGQSYYDTINDLQIRVGPDVGDPDVAGCTVTIAYGKGSTAGVPDVALIPWLTPPMNTYETVDIWIDSSCNGYEDESHLLRYGRRADVEQTVIGNGDDACANRENRVYARVRNLGTAPANDVRVRFEVTRPLGMGIRDSEGWDPIEDVDSSDFASLASIPAGGFADVYATWTPIVERVTERPESRFPFHSCVRVKVDTVSGERLTSNQDGDGEQENIAWFEAVVGGAGVATAPFESIRTELNLINELADHRTEDGECFSPPGDFGCDADIDLDDYHALFDCLNGPLSDIRPGCSHVDLNYDAHVDLADMAIWQNNFTDSGDAKWFQLRAISKLPPGWNLTVGDGESWLFLQPDEHRVIPVTIEVPRGEPVGQSYFAEVTASVLTGAYGPSGERHSSIHQIGGVILAAQTVLQTQLSLNPIRDLGSIFVDGELTPPVAFAPVQVEFFQGLPDLDPEGVLLLSTDAMGRYAGKFEPASPGEWTVASMWQGDWEHSWAESPEVSVTVMDRCPDGNCQDIETCASCPEDCRCDDFNPCTDDSCDSALGCVYGDNTATCDDDDACTTNDRCANGACAGSPVNCDDGNPCTQDGCIPNASVCIGGPNAGQPCTTNAECSPPGMCELVPGPCVHEPILGCCVVVADCEDGNPCTQDGCIPNAGVCIGGVNVGAPCTNDAKCPDSVCELVPGACVHEPILGCCVADADCDDGNPCTQDGCIPNASVCIGGPNAGQPCTTNAECSPPGMCELVPGACAHEPILGCCVVDADCDDGNACTDDSCDPSTGCVHVDNTAPCCGNGVCEPGETCVTCSQDCGPCAPFSCCIPHIPPMPPFPGCDDPVVQQCVCLVFPECCYIVWDELCVWWGNLECGSGCCPEGSACDDGDACTTNDTCFDGECFGSPPFGCNDGNPCTTDSCIGGACQYTNNSASCNDGLFCNGADTCSAGTCSVHAGNPCPGPDGDGNCAESCNEAADNCTANDTNGSACNDGAFCSGADTCSNGACSVHVGNPCPGPDGDGNCAESCNETADNCTANDANGSSCNDGTFCNGADTCSNGACSVHTGDPCAGGPECKDRCTEQTDSCFDPFGTPCSDDGNVCTDNVCDGDGRCVPLPNTAPCDDGLFCNGADRCSNGNCSMHFGNACGFGCPCNEVGGCGCNPCTLACGLCPCP